MKRANIYAILNPIKLIFPEYKSRKILFLCKSEAVLFLTVFVTGMTQITAFPSGHNQKAITLSVVITSMRVESMGT